MNARDIMNVQVVTLEPGMLVPDIARIFSKRGISGAPVMENGEVIGIVTQLDLIARHARPHYPAYLPLLDARIPLGGQREYLEVVRRILAMTARDVMTTPAQSVDVEADLEDVATLMVEEKVNPVPVLEHGKLVGIISEADLIRHLEEAQPLPS